MKLKLLLSILAFAVLIGGASVAYSKLSEKNGGGSNLQILGSGQGTSPSSGGEGSAVSVNPSVPSTPTQGAPQEESVEEQPSEQSPTQSPPAEEDPPENPPVEEDPPVQPIVPSVPDFTVYDVNGRAVKLSDYFGKPIVLNFFASWCNPCRSEMPAFQAQYEALSDEVAFVFVSVDNTISDAKKFVDSQGYTFPILHDAAGSASAAYAVRSIPATFFIDRNGTLVAQAVGALSHADLATGIGLIK